ncbi:unnamed protein product, partial [Staurois parvus]
SGKTRGTRVIWQDCGRRVIWQRLRTPSHWQDCGRRSHLARLRAPRCHLAIPARAPSVNLAILWAPSHPGKTARHRVHWQDSAGIRVIWQSG